MSCGLCSYGVTESAGRPGVVRLVTVLQPVVYEERRRITLLPTPQHQAIYIAVNNTHYITTFVYNLEGQNTALGDKFVDSSCRSQGVVPREETPPRGPPTPESDL